MVGLLTFAAFLPALQSGFVTWDDDRNFTDNFHYRGLGLQQLHWMWTTFHMGHYVPLSWMTLGADYSLWGMNPSGYHLTNLLLHATNAVLVYLLARRLLARSMSLEGPTLDISSAFAALLFSIHPLRVESVAWVTERRDVLSLFFCLSSVLCYLRHVNLDRDRRWYCLSLGAFVCAILSKATSMTVPAVLLLIDIYPLRRAGGDRGWRSESARRVYLEVAPYAALSLGAAVLSIVALHPPEQLNLSAKIAVSAYSLAFYVWKTLVPTHLSPVYEMPRTVDPAALRFLVSYAAVAGLTCLAFAPPIRRRWPGMTAAWTAFVVVTLPMLGIVQNGPQIAADRYTYHAAPALSILTAATLALAAKQTLARVIAFTVLIVFGALTWNQTLVWHDSASFWTYVVERDESSSIGQVGLASVLMAQDRVSEAMEHYARGVALDPRYPEGHNNYGVALARLGKLSEAAEQYRQAVAIRPDYAEAHDNWGVVLARQGNMDEAIERFERVLQLDPQNAAAQVNWGNALVRLGKPDEAIVHYRESLRLRSDNADAHLNWGVALAQQGKLSDAIEHFRAALAIDPNQTEARAYLDQAIRLQPH